VYFDMSATAGSNRRCGCTRAAYFLYDAAVEPIGPLKALLALLRACCTCEASQSDCDEQNAPHIHALLRKARLPRGLDDWLELSSLMGSLEPKLSNQLVLGNAFGERRPPTMCERKRPLLG
jgi:hypothetical protein